MDRSVEIRITRSIQQRLGKHLFQEGFVHTKSTLYVRENVDYFDVLHIHKYSSGPKFRLHCAIRVVTDSFDAIALNGPDSHSYGISTKQRMEFSEETKSIENCLAELIDFYESIGREYFSLVSTSNIGNYLAKERIDSEEIRKESYKLLGIRKKHLTS